VRDRRFHVVVVFPLLATVSVISHDAEKMPFPHVSSDTVLAQSRSIPRTCMYSSVVPSCHGPFFVRPVRLGAENALPGVRFFGAGYPRLFVLWVRERRRRKLSWSCSFWFGASSRFARFASSIKHALLSNETAYRLRFAAGVEEITTSSYDSSFYDRLP